MWSKVHPGGEGVEARRWRWRSAQGAPAAPAGSGAEAAFPGTGGREGELHDRFEAIEGQAYASGEAAGRAAGEQRAMERLAPVHASLSAMVQELAATRQRVRQEAEAGTVELAMAIARRVLHREIATDPEAILGLVKAAAERMNAREIHRLRVAPDDARVIQEHRPRLHLPPGLEVVADPTLATGSAVFETARGEMDASIGTQLEEIQRGLADLVRRRAR